MKITIELIKAPAGVVTTVDGKDVPGIAEDADLEDTYILVKQILRDALGEFVVARMPVERYVINRYQGSGMNLQKKAEEVRTRIAAAAHIIHSVSETLEVTR